MNTIHHITEIILLLNKPIQLTEWHSCKQIPWNPPCGKFTVQHVEYAIGKNIKLGKRHLKIR